MQMRPRALGHVPRLAPHLPARPLHRRHRGVVPGLVVGTRGSTQAQKWRTRSPHPSPCSYVAKQPGRAGAGEDHTAEELVPVLGWKD